MTRLSIIWIAALGAVAGCAHDDNDGMTSYCDNSGCYACKDSSRQSCWALPHPSCAASSECAPGSVCTSIGCCTGCHSSGDCRKGEYCTSQSYCAPMDVNATPVGSSQGPSKAGACVVDADCSGKVCNGGLCVAACKANLDCAKGLVCDGGKCRTPGAPSCGVVSVALCAGDADCGGGRVCAGGSCHVACANGGKKCPLGQACSGGACVDAAPAVAQCVWDADCGPATRCINATCHPLCGQTSQCSSGEFCDSGVCRADYRAAR